MLFFNNINIHIEQISFSVLSEPERVFALLGRGHDMLAAASFIDQMV